MQPRELRVLSSLPPANSRVRRLRTERRAARPPLQYSQDLIYGNQTTTYGYDANDRVAAAGSGVSSNSFVWDKAGNRSTQTAQGGYLSHVPASNSNRLTAVTGSQWRNFA